MFLNGDLYDGYKNYAGEVGHMTVVPEGRICGAGITVLGSLQFRDRDGEKGEIHHREGQRYVTEEILSDNLEAKVIAGRGRKGDFIAEHIFNEAAKFSGWASRTSSIY